MENTDPIRLHEADELDSGCWVLNGLLDVNEATLEQLEALPGIGPLKARRMMMWRERNGPFRSLEDLKYIRGFGPTLVSELATHLFVSDPEPKTDP